MIHSPLLVGLTVINIFFILLLVLFMLRKKTAYSPALSTTVQTGGSRTVVTSSDVKAIAGDNVIATQLDLARAYIELSKNNLARQILEHVIKNGDHEQQKIAHNLLFKLN